MKTKPEGKPTLGVDPDPQASQARLLKALQEVLAVATRGHDNVRTLTPDACAAVNGLNRALECIRQDARADFEIGKTPGSKIKRAHLSQQRALLFVATATIADSSRVFWESVNYFRHPEVVSWGSLYPNNGSLGLCLCTIEKALKIRRTEAQIEGIENWVRSKLVQDLMVLRPWARLVSDASDLHDFLSA